MYVQVKRIYNSKARGCSSGAGHLRPASCAPLSTELLLARHHLPAAERPAEIDLTSVIAGDGTYSFALESPSTNGADFVSREGALANRPRLVIVIQ